MTPEQQQAIDEATRFRDENMAQQNFTPRQQMAIKSTERLMREQAKPRDDMPASEILPQVADNFLPSAKRFGSDIWQAVSHPIDTAKALGQLGKEIIGATPLKYEFGLQDEGTESLEAVGKMFADRYGSIEKAKQTLAKDPVGFAADASTVLSGGGSAAARAPGIAGKVGKTVAKVGNVIDPLTLAAKGTGKFFEGLKWGGSELTGMMSGAGSTPIKQAYKAGKAGGLRGRNFRKNYFGRESGSGVVKDAIRGMKKMAQDRMDDFVANSPKFKKSKKKLDWGDINASQKEMNRSMWEGGHSKLTERGRKVVDDINGTLDEWRKDPNAHTAKGLDALKQKIEAISPGEATVSSPTELQRLKAAKTKMYNSVKDTIVREVPEYADVMKAYEEAIQLEQELSKALSLGSTQNIDATLKKLQSVMRNNANTNYGYRTELIDKLEKATGAPLMDKLAGQSLDSWSPRSLQQLVASGTGVYGVTQNPWALSLLPLQSPKIVGGISHGVGRGMGMTEKMLEGLRLTPELARNVGRGFFQGGRIKEEVN